MSFLEMHHVAKGFGSGDQRTDVLHDINLSIEENEFVAIVGFSGSGKSTLINLLAGLLAPDAGGVTMAGQPISEPGPDRGVVFQNYSLLPWLSVVGNIELAVKQVFPELTRRQRREHIQHYVDMVSLTGSEWKRPKELSGGMRQRVAVARALAMQPEVLLLDEPLGALDALTRSVLQDEIIRIWQDDRRTVLLITNDVDEAILMADRIVPLTVGPAATLEREFIVDLPRPRERASINFNPRFKEIRNAVTNYLLHLKDAHRQATPPLNFGLPNIRPVRISA